MSDAASIMLKIDAEAVRRFASVVFDGLPGHVCCRILPEKGGPDLRPITTFLANDEQLATALVRQCEAAAQASGGCFVVPGTVLRAGTARAADIAATAVVLVDLDVGDIDAKRAHLVEHLGLPTLEVASGGLTDAGLRKLHLYWRLARPATGAALRQVMDVRRMIAAKVGGDPAFGRISQPVRIAGSIHAKHRRLAPVEILSERPGTFELETLAAAAERMPRLEQEPDPLPPAPQRVRSGGLDGITRFDAITRCIGSQLAEMRLGRITRAEAWSQVLAYNGTVLDPPWPEAKLETEFAALERLDRSNHGVSAAEPVSEDWLAQLLAAEHGQHWKHSSAMAGWLRWSQDHWASTSGKGVIELARDCARRVAAGLRPQDQRRLLSNHTVQAVARLAASDVRMSADGISWDADPMLLNTPMGIVDLRTGEITPNDPAAAMTRIAGAAPGGDCPRWRAFLATLTGGDGELEAYLGRVAGYCLTGSTSEQVFFFLHGAGANGKSVFMAALAEILGSYATTAPLDAFMASRSDRHPTDLAGLRGARFVSVTETEPGRSWAESRIKTVTGGDAMSARLMYRDFFEFVPTFKLMIAGNHRPRLTSCGEAMRRRLHLIPCPTTVPPSARDGDLLARLRAERGGILSWALEGCMEWQRQGLAPPRAVRDAATAYFEDEDLVGQWIADRCILGKGRKAASQALYASWSDWARRAGIEPGSTRALGERLKELKFTPVREARMRGWSGLSLRDEAAGAVEGAAA